MTHTDEVSEQRLYDFPIFKKENMQIDSHQVFNLHADKVNDLLKYFIFFSFFLRYSFIIYEFAI